MNLHAGLLVRTIAVKFLSSYLYGYLSRHKPIDLHFNVVTYIQDTKDKTTVLENSLENVPIRLDAIIGVFPFTLLFLSLKSN